MATLRINQFRGIAPAISPKLLGQNYATIAHNTLLRDGKLRPYASWRKIAPGNSSYQSIRHNTRLGNMSFSETKDAVRVEGAPFTFTGLVGARAGGLDVVNELQGSTYTANVNLYVNASISAVTSYQGNSTKPVPRAYAFSIVRYTGAGIEESNLKMVSGEWSKAILYEGDTVAFTASLSSAQPNHSIRLYRTATALADPSSLNASLDTNWHLIGEVATLSIPEGEPFFYDGGDPGTDAFDVNVSGGFFPPPTEGVEHFGLTNSGWFVYAKANGTVGFSEKFLVHAWPIEHVFSVPNAITDIVVYYDTVFIGTNGTPFSLNVRDGDEAGLVGVVSPYPEAYPCLPGTMAATPTGAVYCAAQGVLSLDAGGQKLITRGIANSGDTLYRVEYEVDTETKYKNLQFKDASTAFSYKGQYFATLAYAYGRVEYEGPLEPVSKTAFVLDLQDTVNGPREFQHLVTMDFPDGKLKDATVGPQGLYILHSLGTYVLPLPDNLTNVTYEQAAKMVYKWRSKEFSLNSDIAPAAAKIEMKGPAILFRVINGCNVVYETEVCNSKPFTLPSQIFGNSFYIELEGRAEVSEIVLATSLRELMYD